MKKKQIMGYAYRTGSESPKEAVENYMHAANLHSSKEGALREMKHDKEHGVVSKQTKLTMVRVIVEDCE